MKRRRKGPKKVRVTRNGVASVPHKKFRRREKDALNRLRQGEDPDTVQVPTQKKHGDNPWNYD